MPTHTPQIPTRTEWTRARDSAKVPAGAAKVSIGKAIDAFYASWNARKLDDNLTSTSQLIANLATYVAAIRPKYLTFVATVQKIKKGAESHKALLEEVIKAKTLYYPVYADIAKALMQVKINAPGAPKPKDVAKQVMKLKGIIDALALVDSNWEARRRKVSVLFLQLDGGIKEWISVDGNDSAFQAIVNKLNELKP